MSGLVVLRTVRPMARATTTATSSSQRRSFLNWMTNYPDRIVELKQKHQAGGREVFTWQKQPQDKYTTGIAAGLSLLGLAQIIPGFYRLAYGKGKLE